MMAGFDDRINVLVSLGFFLGEPPAGGASDEDAAFCKAGTYLPAAGVAGGLVAALHTTGTMRGRKERRVAGDPGKHIRRRAHGPGYQHGLADRCQFGR